MDAARAQPNNSPYRPGEEGTVTALGGVRTPSLLHRADHALPPWGEFSPHGSKASCTSSSKSDAYVMAYLLNFAPFRGGGLSYASRSYMPRLHSSYNKNSATSCA